MLVLLDIENKQIQLYTENGLELIDFENADTLKQFVGNQSITYIVNTMPAKAVDVIKTVIAIDRQQGRQNTSTPTRKAEPLYLCPNVEGAINISGLMNIKTGKRDEIVLSKNAGLPKGVSSIPLSLFHERYGEDALEKYGSLSSLLKSKKIIIVPQSRFRATQTEHDQDQQENENMSLSSIVGSRDGVEEASHVLDMDTIKREAHVLGQKGKSGGSSKRPSKMKKQDAGIVLNLDDENDIGEGSEGGARKIGEIKGRYGGTADGEGVMLPGMSWEAENEPVIIEKPREDKKGR